jgi:hypothetical protein
MLPIMLAADEAEARGDATAAFDLIAAAPFSPDGTFFWRPGRVLRLAQLHSLREVLPQWATSRWILAQAHQSVQEQGGSRLRDALSVALETSGAERWGVKVDPARVMDHDWVYRQVLLYESGGLEHFMRQVACADLLVGADRIEDWALTPMGAFTLLAESSGMLTWKELGSGREVRTPNLGAATMVWPGGCVLGRLVPIEDGYMFESAPLSLPRAPAEEVAEDPGRWLDVVARACRDEYVREEDDEICVTGHFDFDLLTDVPALTQHFVQHLVRDGAWAAIHDDCDSLELSLGLVRAALHDRLVPSELLDDPWPSVSAALVVPSVSRALYRESGPGDAGALRRLAARLPRPASSVCTNVAAALDEAA